MEVRDEIRTLVEMQERMIRERDTAAWACYVARRDAAIASADRTEDASIDDRRLMNNYLASSSFIGSFYHIEGNVKDRDKLAESCALLCSGMGYDMEEVHHKHLQITQVMAQEIQNSSFSPKAKQSAGCVLLFVTATLAAIASIYMR